MSFQVTGGAVDVTTYFALTNIVDNTPATSLTITDIDLQYTRSGATPAAKVDATALGAANSAHSDNKAFEIDATDQPGVYRVDWPDAAFAAGVKEVILSVKCSGVYTEHLRVLIDAPVNMTRANDSTVTFDDTPSVNSIAIGGVAVATPLVTANGGIMLSFAGVVAYGNCPAGTAVSLGISLGASGPAFDITGFWVRVYAGKGAGQEKRVTAYDTGTKIATVESAWYSGAEPSGNDSSQWVLLSRATDNANFTQMLGTALTEGAAGRLAAGFQGCFNVATPVFTVASVNQTGDSYSRIGAAGAGLTNIVLPSGGLANVSAWTVAITGDITGNLSGSVSSVTTVTGYKLASDGLDAIATTAPTGVASNFREMLVQVWRRLMKKAVLDTGANTLKTYADNNSTVLTTQTVTTSGDVQTQGPAS
jgi:hypothetical protein